jgi:hypothetical protein
VPRNPWNYEREVERVVRSADGEDRDPDGRRRFVGRVGTRRVRVVIALDDPDLVVTVHDRGD